jgi:1-pyrroline-5-carboxylate dehydrogenase
MNNIVFGFEIPANEPARSFAPGTADRREVQRALADLSAREVEIPLVVGGRELRTGNLRAVRNPGRHGQVLARVHQAGEAEVESAIASALAAKREWETMSWVERASITLKAADLIATKYRYQMLAATMLGQGKNVYQAEIDAACETIDFLRYNAYFASGIYADQPRSGFDQLNRLEYRPLEGFVLTVSPFNFTAIGSNLNMAPVLMGNTTVWKPASTAVLSSYLLMQIYREAGLPDGVVNFVPGSGSLIGRVALRHHDLAGLHFTGSNRTFNQLWRGMADHLERYRAYPRIVGETGGKGFILVHRSSDAREVATAIVRGGFEYQGQKCSAASRAYLPRSLWPQVHAALLEMVGRIRMGDVDDFGNFMNPVIDEASFDNIMGYVEQARRSPAASILAGGHGDKSEGYFIEPTLILTTDPHFVTMEEEIFGPVMTLYVYEDEDWPAVLELCDATSPYALTGAVFSRDRYAFVEACRALRHAAGNFYLNDKPTGAMVGLQPFGGARASGTNDKAGGPLNLLRWVSPRTIKETFVPATTFEYPFMSPESL